MAKGLRELRNIGIMAHIDAGKTTCTERVLYFAGRTYKIGEVHDGTAVMDYLTEEQQRGITITSAATTLEWRDHTINLIDTPGHVDFTIEVERSLRVLDGAVAVFCAVGGVEAQSETVWHQADRYHVPRICFINKMDRMGADFEKVVDEISSHLLATPLVLQIPMGSGEDFVGPIDLITRKAYAYKQVDVAAEREEIPIPPEYEDEVELHRHDLLEKVADFDDELLDKFLHDKPISAEEIIRAIRKATIAGQLHPVLCGSALKHMGVQLLLDAVIDYLPSPLDIPPVNGHEDIKSDTIVERRCDPDEPFSALVFKITSDQHGDLNYARIYSGTLPAGTRVFNSTQRTKENVARIWEMHAKQRIRRDEAGPGDIVALVGLRKSQTGDTLCEMRHHIVLERLAFPDPVITMAIEPRTNADKQRLAEALIVLRREDPSFQCRYDEETGQSTISGMGELHLEIIKNKLVRDMGVDVRVGRPSVAYKETVSAAAEAEGRFIRQTGGRGQYGVVELRVEPYTPGDDEDPVAFESAIKGGAISGQYIPSVEEGVRAAAGSGALTGCFPIINVKATLLDGKEHPEDSSDIAFHQAAALAFNEAVAAAGPTLLEPVMRVQVNTPEDYFGAVSNDLTRRRGVIRETDQRGRLRVLMASAPLSEMFGYATELRSLTQGRASYTMEPEAYAPVPPEVAGNILKEF
ncbi:MAG: elongation factor G [Planctomycetota bacterium]|jgi:elongation factor G